MNRYKKISSKTLHTHPRLTLIEDIIILPDGSTSDYIRYENQPDGVTVVVINDKNQILVNNEYTYPVDEYMLQMPGGTIDLGETPLEAAARELQEEVGIVAKDLNLIGSTLYDHRRSLSTLYFCLAKNLSYTNTSLEVAEFIHPLWIDLDEFKKKVKNGEVKHIGTLAAWAYYLNQHS